MQVGTKTLENDAILLRKSFLDELRYVGKFEGEFTSFS